MELSDKTDGWVILFNDSQKRIEAANFIGKCGAGGMEYTHDVLRKSIVEFDIGAFAEPGLPFWMKKMTPQASGCTWEGNISAVIYSDGTYEGDEKTVRMIQAERDGLLAALQYWTDRLQSEASKEIPAEVVLADAKRLSDEGFNKITTAPACRHWLANQALACAYWNGRHLVDGNVAIEGATRPKVTYARLIPYFDKWRKRVEADKALKKLNEVFPLPSDIAAHLPNSAVHQ